MTNPSALCRFSRSPSTEAPTLHRRYPASLVLRASPPPHTAQPDSHELPVDAFAITAGASRVASGPPCLHAVANTPAGPMKPVRSYCSIGVDLPRPKGGSAPASPVSRPAHRVAFATLCTEGFSGFVTSTTASVVTGRNEPVPGRDFHPLWTSAFSRRTFGLRLRTQEPGLTTKRKRSSNDRSLLLANPEWLESHNHVGRVRSPLHHQGQLISAVETNYR